MVVSNTPWSDFKESDYTIEQWRRACLISPPQASDSKAEYKLPIKEPSGALNRNGCHSAAAALAGARGGINASTESQKAAAKKLVSLYRNQLEEDPPASLLRLSGESVQMSEEVDDFLAHYGVKGMKWGVRRNRVSGDSSSSAKPKRLTRKEKRVEKKAFYEAKASRILNKALEDPEVLVSIRTPNSPYPTIATGREFVSHVTRGGMFDIRATDIFAEKTSDGYVRNERMNERYRPSR